MTKPLLSIVIANYNYGRFLEEAIQSVVNQGMGDKIELIICDAKSTDNSVEIIKKYAGRLPPNTPLDEWLAEPSNRQTDEPSNHLISWWCSEKDGGQSAAFNKGFSHARGEWLTWLNADDLYLPGALSAFAELVKRKPDSEWITGNKVHFDSGTGKIVRLYWGPHMMPPLLRKNHASHASFGPSSFFRRSLWVRLGGLDEKMHYAMDTEYWARFTMAGVRQTRLNWLCWAFRNHEESKTWGVQTREIAEKRASETKYWRDKTRYLYVHGFSNPWYWLWVFWRVLDISFAHRLALKLRFEGKGISSIGNH